jgi:deoxyribodipyrimidine photo-lyase
MFWMRRDLRAHDNTALHAALSTSDRVLCVFVYDRTILDELPRGDRRVAFIHACIEEAGADLAKLGGRLLAVEGDPATVIPDLARRHDVGQVFANEDYEPAAVRRDTAIAEALARDGRALVLSKDQVLLHKNEVLSKTNTPYTRFTPYYNAWLRRLGQDDEVLRDFDPAPLKAHFDASVDGPANIPLADLGFDEVDLEGLSLYPGTSGARRVFDEFIGKIGDYAEHRNTLALAGTSGMDIHLRFGTFSIRQIFRELGTRTDVHDASVANWIREVCWREYFSQLLYHVPRVADGPYQPKYAKLDWVSGDLGEERLAAWKNAATGYPIVDAAMTQLNSTGAMHNRARLIAGSFLVKTLGVDWRRGEAYFALKLNDYDMASNNGNWQWVASTGADAQPPYRIFNPSAQSKTYDPDAAYIKHWLPALAGIDARDLHEPWRRKAAIPGYPAPIVEYVAATEETRMRYNAVGRGSGGDVGSADE